jgi:predicted SnoaL-like aldol condensation-catalyzing enzyme
MLKKALAIIVMTNVVAYGTQAVFAATPEQEKNKEIASKFLDAVVNTKDFDTAATFIGPTYIEHDPQGTDGKAGLKAYIDLLRANFPDSHAEVKRVFVDDQYVIFHLHHTFTPGTRGNAVVDMFKLENGFITEHWDVSQEVPADSANPNGMF